MRGYLLYKGSWSTLTSEDLEKEFRETLKKGLFEIDPNKSLERSLEKALERTTPETPGDPRDNKVRIKQPEWL